MTWDGPDVPIYVPVTQAGQGQKTMEAKNTTIFSCPLSLRCDVTTKPGATINVRCICSKHAGQYITLGFDSAPERKTLYHE